MESQLRGSWRASEGGGGHGELVKGEGLWRASEGEGGHGEPASEGQSWAAKRLA